MSYEANVNHLANVLKLTALVRAIDLMESHGDGRTDLSCRSILQEMADEIRSNDAALKENNKTT